MYIKELTNEEFNNFSNKFNIKSIYQTVEYALIMQDQKFTSFFVGLIDDSNQIVAASLILIEQLSKFKYAYAPRGFLIDYNNFNLLSIFTKEIKAFLNKKNVMAIKISPLIIKNIYDKKNNVLTKNSYFGNIFTNLQKLGYAHLGYNNYFEALKPRYEAIINLDMPYYMLFRNIRKQFRTKIRTAEKKGVKIYKGDINNLEYLYLQTKKKYPRDLQYFKDCYNYFNRTGKVEFFYSKLDTSAHLKFVQNEYHQWEKKALDYSNMVTNSEVTINHRLLSEKMEVDQNFENYKKILVKATRYLRNYPDGIVTASCLVIKNNDEIFILMDGYDPKYKSLNSKHLLIWKLIERYSKMGFKKFNLNGMTSLNVENNPYNGLNEFKLGFNALSYEYIGDLELITNNALYFMYQNTAPLRNILKR